MFTIYYQKVSTCDETICTNFTIEPEKDTKKLTRKLYEGYSKKIQFFSGPLKTICTIFPLLANFS